MNHYDIVYGVGVGVSAPFWLARSSTRAKVLRAFSQRMGNVNRRDASRPAIMIHAVSLGEINATRALIGLLREARQDLSFIVSVTTETGYARGLELYGNVSDVTLVRYPLDFSSAVERVLTALRPAVVVLMELEVWPNFIRRCAQRKIPVVLVNGRITPGSFRKYRLARPLVGSMFARLQRVAVQDEEYARRFAELGVARDRISVTGTMKFDTATIADSLPGQEELAKAVGLDMGRERVWVCGSTGPGEEEIVVGVYRELVRKYANLRLVIVPRKPERFDEAAEIIERAGFEIVRRSRMLALGSNNSKDPHPNPLPEYQERENKGEDPHPGPLLFEPEPQSRRPEYRERGKDEGGPLPVVLGDTIGELRKFYALAEVVFVGRTLVDLGHRQHGSDMIEPGALGKPTIVGPFTANFADAMERFVAADAMKVAGNGAELRATLEEMLDHPEAAKQMGMRAREVVRAGQGATVRNARIILDTFGTVVTMGRQ